MQSGHDLLALETSADSTGMDTSEEMLNFIQCLVVTVDGWKGANRSLRERVESGPSPL